MKKFAAMMMVWLLLRCGCAAALAEDMPGECLWGQYYYEVLPDGTAEITAYFGQGTEWIVPDKVDGYTVSGIDGEVMGFNDELTRIVLPDTVTSIGDGVFYGCSMLSDIILPDSLTHIGGWAFYSCASLRGIILPDAVTSMGANPFVLCTNLSAIRVSPNHPMFATIDGVLFNKQEKSLVCYPMAFKDEEYSIPHGILSVESSAFMACTTLRKITIPDTVTSIGEAAFYGCENLTEIIIPDTVTSIGEAAFSWCESLTSVILPASVTSIGAGAFSACDSLTCVVVPDTVTSIGEEAFSWCEKLTDVTIPESVTSIGEGAFSFSDNVTLTVEMGSYADAYAKENGIPVTYIRHTSSTDWLFE